MSFLQNGAVEIGMVLMRSIFVEYKDRWIAFKSLIGIVPASFSDPREVFNDF